MKSDATTSLVSGVVVAEETEDMIKDQPVQLGTQRQLYDATPSPPGSGVTAEDQP